MILNPLSPVVWGMQWATKILPLKGEARGVAHSFKCKPHLSDMRLADALVFSVLCTICYCVCCDLLPAGLSVAQPCRYCFYSQAQKWVFRPAGATRCPDKRESWHGGADLRSAPQCQLSRLSGQKCGNTAPKTVKISNFGQKFVPQGRLVCNIFTKFSASVRVYR